MFLSFIVFFVFFGVCCFGIVIFFMLLRYWFVSEFGLVMIFFILFLVIIMLLCMLVFGLILIIWFVMWIVFLLCLIINMVFFRLCKWVRVCSKCLLLCWWRLIEGLLRIYIILIKFVLIWLVRWICWVLLLESVLVLCERFK